MPVVLSAVYCFSCSYALIEEVFKDSSSYLFIEEAGVNIDKPQGYALMEVLILKIKNGTQVLITFLNKEEKQSSEILVNSMICLEKKSQK